MSVQSSVPCPDCGSDIHIDSNLLLSGQSFSCVNTQCTTSIALQTSQIEMVSEAVNKFEQLKQQTIERGRDANTDYGD